MPSLPLASASRSSAGGVFWWCGKTMRSIYAAVLLLYCLSVAAFAPTTMHRCPVHYQTHIIISANNVENDDPTGYSNVDQKNQLSEQSSLIRERIKNGNYLDVLQVSVILFFLLTLWISGGNILSDYSRPHPMIQMVLEKVECTSTFMQTNYCVMNLIENIRK